MQSEMFPLLIAQAIIQRKCHISIAARVYEALSTLSERDAEVLWLRMQGKSYGDIGCHMEMNKGMAWKIIHGPVKRSIYSVIERSTQLRETVAVS
jgi:hypothetical protein